jgi:hypothetical protein
MELKDNDPVPVGVNGPGEIRNQADPLSLLSGQPPAVHDERF